VTSATKPQTGNVERAGRTRLLEVVITSVENRRHYITKILYSRICAYVQSVAFCAKIATCAHRRDKTYFRGPVQRASVRRTVQTETH